MWNKPETTSSKLWVSDKNTIRGLVLIMQREIWRALRKWWKSKWNDLFKPKQYKVRTSRTNRIITDLFTLSNPFICPFRVKERKKNKMYKRNERRAKNREWETRAAVWSTTDVPLNYRLLSSLGPEDVIREQKNKNGIEKQSKRERLLFSCDYERTSVPAFVALNVGIRFWIFRRGFCRSS